MSEPVATDTLLTKAMSQRHAQDRPLAKLKNEELLALTVIARHADILHLELELRLTRLGDLAQRELADRELAAELGRVTP